MHRAQEDLPNIRKVTVVVGPNMNHPCTAYYMSRAYHMYTHHSIEVMEIIVNSASWSSIFASHARMQLAHNFAVMSYSTFHET